MTYPHNSNDNRNTRDPRNQPAPDQRRAERPPTRKEDLKIPHDSQHMAVCVSHSFGMGSKAEQIGVACKIVEGEFAGQVLFWYGSFSPDAKEFTFRGMRAFGFKGDNVMDCSSMYPDRGGRPARITVQHDEYDGEWRLKVAWVNDDGVVMKKPLEGRDLEVFAARMRAELRHAGGGGPAPGPGPNPAGYYGQGNPPTGGGGRGGPPGNQGSFNDSRPRDPWDEAPPAEPPPDSRYGGRR